MTVGGASRPSCSASRASDLDLRPNTSQAPAPTGTHARVRRAFSSLLGKYHPTAQTLLVTAPESATDLSACRAPVSLLLKVGLSGKVPGHGRSSSYSLTTRSAAAEVGKNSRHYHWNSLRRSSDFCIVQ